MQHHGAMELIGSSSDDEKAQRLVVCGRVEAGVEPGSVVLVAEPGGIGAATYQLGRAWQHAVGRRVDAVVQTLPGMMTTAQQGLPVRVVSLADADADADGLGPDGPVRSDIGPGGAADAGGPQPAR